MRRLPVNAALPPPSAVATRVNLRGGAPLRYIRSSPSCACARRGSGLGESRPSLRGRLSCAWRYRTPRARDRLSPHGREPARRYARMGMGRCGAFRGRRCRSTGAPGAAGASRSRGGRGDREPRVRAARGACRCAAYPPALRLSLVLGRPRLRQEGRDELESSRQLTGCPRGSGLGRRGDRSWTLRCVIERLGPMLIPRPTTMTATEGDFELDEAARIAAPDELAGVAAWLQGALRPATGLSLGESSDGPIRLVLEPALDAEAFRLAVTTNGIRIEGGGAAGVFYGCQAFLQLLPPAVFRRGRVSGVRWAVPAVQIQDAPRFTWRGAMLDVGRHFMPKHDVLRFIDLMAMHRLNVLHLHLTEDEGWRIEIRRYPRLTEVGAWRRESQMGARPDAPGDGRPHGGYYTQDDIREIVAYAAERFITVVPEIESPGHVQAALAAYPELGVTGEQLEVWTRWGINQNVLNVEESTVDFFTNVLDEVMELFPSPYIGVGGDECPKDQWRADPRTQQRMAELGVQDEEALQSWFIRRLDDHLTAAGRRLYGWDEILEGGLASGATVASWRGMTGAITAARRGHDVVAASCCGDRTGHTAPRGDGGAGRKPAFEDLVPTEQSASSGREVVVQTSDEPALQRLLVLHAEFRHALLRARVRTPLILGAFVAAHADVRRREQLHDLVEHVREEIDRALLHVEYILVDAPPGPHLQLLPAHSQLGVSGERRLHMTRRLDLGDHRDEPRISVGNDLADVVLRVVAAVRASVAGRVRLRADLALPAPRAHLGQSRVAKDLDAPTLVLGQVQMQHVEPVHGHEVDETQHVMLRHEVARHVEHGAAPGEPRRILDLHGGDDPTHAAHLAAPEHGGRKQLQESLTAVEDPGHVAAVDSDAVWRHSKLERLCAKRGLRRKTDRTVRALAHRKPCSGAQRPLQPGRNACEPGRRTDTCRSVELEVALGSPHGDRTGNKHARQPLNNDVNQARGGFHLGTLGCWPAGDFGVRATPGHSISWSPASRSTKMETPFPSIHSPIHSRISSCKCRDWSVSY